MLEIYRQLTSELSKLDNDILNNSICSHEPHLEEMSADELHEAAQELIWMAQEMQEESMEYDGEEYDVDATYKEEILEEAETLLEKLAEYL
jgi:hypothetical protein